MRPLLLALLLASLAVWYRTLGTVSVESVSTPRAEVFYWVTIMFSQTLGTALGDWTADSAGMGYGGAAVVFGGLLALIAESDLNDARLVTPQADGGYGLDAQWSDDFHHAVHVALTGETSGYYADFAPLAALGPVA